jgi:uncharacterized protein (TIGR02147 family)
VATPDVLEYAEYRKYLSDWFDAKKAEQPKLSHRWVMRRVGSRDPSVLISIVSGRRPLAADRLDAFVDMLELDGVRAEYFRALVAFGEAQTPQAASAAWTTLAELRFEENVRGIRADELEFLSTWYIPATHELARNPAFQGTAAWVAAHLEPAITEDEAQRALDVCARLGYLVEADGGLRYAQISAVTAPMVRKLASWPYHRDGLALADRGLQKIRAGADRHFIAGTVFLGGTFAVHESRLPELRRAVFDLLTRLGATTDAWEDTPDRVLQVEVSMVPVGRMDRPYEPHER